MTYPKIDNANELSLETKLLPEQILHSEIMNKIIVEIYNGWPGPTGLQRVVDKIDFISKILPQYAKLFKKSELETLEMIAKSRNVNYVNYFQYANLPDLKDVYIFESQSHYLAEFPSKQFYCPHCEGISTNPQECNSGITINNKTCDWKSYGLFGTLETGIKVLIKSEIKDRPRPTEIFKPIELIKL